MEFWPEMLAEVPCSLLLVGAHGLTELATSANPAPPYDCGKVIPNNLSIWKMVVFFFFAVSYTVERSLAHKRFIAATTRLYITGSKRPKKLLVYVILRMEE